MQNIHTHHHYNQANMSNVIPIHACETSDNPCSHAQHHTHGRLNSTIDRLYSSFTSLLRPPGGTATTPATSRNSILLIRLSRGTETTQTAIRASLQDCPEGWLQQTSTATRVLTHRAIALRPGADWPTARLPRLRRRHSSHGEARQSRI